MHEYNELKRFYSIMAKNFQQAKKKPGGIPPGFFINQ
jgi:hypothetical protein